MTSSAWRGVSGSAIETQETVYLTAPQRGVWPPNLQNPTGGYRSPKAKFRRQDSITNAESVRGRTYQVEASRPRRRLGTLPELNCGVRPSLGRNTTTSRETGGRVNRHSCQETLPRSQWLASRVVGAEVAGAYVWKAAYRLVESDSFPLSVGGRKSREAGWKPWSPKLVNASPATAA